MGEKNLELKERNPSGYRLLERVGFSWWDDELPMSKYY